jgi:hypothetical protein
MKFSGSVCGQAFSGIAAVSSQDLYEIVAGSTTSTVPPISDFRCWVSIATDKPGDSVWVEIHLGWLSFFQKMAFLLSEDVTIVFKKTPCNSPESSTNNRPDKDGDLLALQQDLSASSIAESTISSNSEKDPRPNSGRSLGVINKSDPFTLEEVESVEDPLFLHFHKRLSVEFDTICVSMSAFEQYVHSESEAGKNPTTLQLINVECQNGQRRKFILSKQVWVRSILTQSTASRRSFTEFFSCAVVREDQLEEMKKEKDFWERIMFWIQDFLSFEESQDRLSLPPTDGEYLWMSPFYFHAEEPQYVGSLMMPNTITLRETLQVVMAGKHSAGAVEICASHDLAPILITAFEMHHGFHKNATFKQKKSQWIKNRQKEMKSMASSNKT